MAALENEYNPYDTYMFLKMEVIAWGSGDEKLIFLQPIWTLGWKKLAKINFIWEEFYVIIFSFKISWNILFRKCKSGP